MLNFDFLRKGSRTSFPPHFVYFQEKCFSCYILLTDQISLSDCLYVFRYRAICVLQNFCCPSCDVIRFKLNFIFLIKLFSYMLKKSSQDILRTKSAFEVKYFSSFLKGYQLPKIVSELGVRL